MRIRSLIVLFIFSSLNVMGQGFVAPLIIHDNGSGADTLAFGHYSGATRCIDAAFGEFELPPKPPTGVFDARFTDPAGAGECFGQGVRCNLRENIFFMDDTFQVEFQAGDGGFPMTLSWPSNLSSYGYLEIRLVDLFGGVLINVDMLANSSTQITNSAFSQLRIISHIITRETGSSRVSCCTICQTFTNVAEDKNKPQQIKEVTLHQNYPNPFNPSTTIRYDLPHRSFVTIEIYDLLGRRVVMLVSDEIEQGAHQIEWNGKDFSNNEVVGGVYLVRMHAEYRGTEGMLNYASNLRKIVLMR